VAEREALGATARLRRRPVHGSEDLKKELCPGFLFDMLKQLGIRKEDL
jgi:hypothetical protein